jgi:site-specific DNA recombinase
VALVRALIYNCVSSDPRGIGRSVDEQDTENRAVCDREGWSVVGVFTDNDRSASRYARKGRPDWQRLTEALASGNGDVLVTWEISRATRDRVVWAALVEVCMDRGVKLYVGGRLHDLDDPDDAFALDLTSSLAVRESAVTRKRVLRAVRANAANGRPHGKLLYGYRREYDETTGQLLRQVVREDQAVVVREAARRVAGGETPYAVAQDFNRRGILAPRAGALFTRTRDGKQVKVPAAGTWDLRQIKRTITNPAYIGKRVHNGRVVGDATWPPILDEETHYALERKLTDPSRRTKRDSAVRHLLSGIATCGLCDGKIRVLKGRGYLVYGCSERFHVARREDWVDDFVERVAIERLSRPDIAELLTDDSLQDDARAARAEAAEKRARLDQFYDAAAAGELTPAALARIEARLLPEIHNAERRSQRAAMSPLLRDLARPDIAATWRSLPMTTKREVIDALMRIRILAARRGSRKFDPATVEITWKTEAG